MSDTRDHGRPFLGVQPGEAAIAHKDFCWGCQQIEDLARFDKWKMSALLITGSPLFHKQEFFEKDMGLPLTMTPNYEDFSCQ